MLLRSDRLERVSYEVLLKSAPGLPRALPEREEGLDDEAYWAQEG